MNKISGILPANARVTTVDLKNSGTQRAGMPSFGRSMGVSSAQERENERTTAARANEALKNQKDIRSTQLDPKAEIVQRLADDFFANKAKINNQEYTIVHDDKSDMAVDLPSEIISADDGKAKTKEAIAFSDLVQNQEVVEADEDAPAVGKYLDVQA